MSQFADFVTKNNGQPVEVEDPSALDQCMDLAFAWCDFIGVDRATIRHQYAYQIWTQPIDLTVQIFDYIPNTPNGVPKEGDIVVFNQSVGSAGHVSIATGVGDSNGFQSFDQNWSGASYAKLVNHVYTSVSGWLHKKDTQLDPVILSQSDSFIAICTLLNVAASKDLAIAEVNKLISIEDAAPAKDKQIQDAQVQIVGFQAQITTLQQQHEELNATVNGQAKTILDQDSQIKSLSTSIQELKNQLQQPLLTGWQEVFDGLKKVFGWG